MSDWTLVTGYDHAYDPIAELTLPTFERYAERHGMWLEANDWTGREPKSELSWCRIEDLRRAMGDGDGAIFVDIDACFLALERSIVGSLGPEPVHIAYQTLGGFRFPSCGIIAVRNDADGWAWLNAVEAKRTSVSGHPWCEQAATYELLGYDSTVLSPAWGDPDIGTETEWRPKVGFVDCRWHSTPQDRVEDAYLFHATGGVGVGVDRRVDWLREVLR